MEIEPIQSSKNCVLVRLPRLGVEGFFDLKINRVIARVASEDAQADLVRQTGSGLAGMP